MAKLSDLISSRALSIPHLAFHRAQVHADWFLLLIFALWTFKSVPASSLVISSATDERGMSDGTSIALLLSNLIALKPQNSSAKIMRSYTLPVPL